MNVEVRDRGTFSWALVHLEAGEEFVSESGAMFRSSTTIDIDVTTRSRGQGGFLAGVKRLLGGDSFFLSRYHAESAGEVGVAPTLQGSVELVELDGSVDWVCAGGSYLASGPELQLDTKFQGLRGMFSGESLFFMEVSGHGPLLVSAFGHLQEIEVDGGLTVDTGHVVAFTRDLDYQLSKAGGSWFHSWLAGEGIVLEFSGRGRVLVQSHNPGEYGRDLGSRLPPRER